jgi:small-conductance mechanosensitive channel
MIEWLTDNWYKIAIPMVAFLATCVVGLWLKRVSNNALSRWGKRTEWKGIELIRIPVGRSIFFWFLILGAAIGVQVSVLPAETKSIIIKVLSSLFVLSLGWIIIFLSERILNIYLPRVKFSRPTIIFIINLIRIILIIFAALVMLDIWGIPTTPVLLLIAVVVLALAITLRNIIPDLFAGINIGSSLNIKVGDYIKLETGEEGNIIEISWNNIRLKGINEITYVVPNRQLLQHKVINYGLPLKKAKEPFRFYIRTNLTELTGIKAKNLDELNENLKKVPDAVIEYHTHRFLEEHNYLTPEPANDFGIWIGDTLGEEALGERMASVNTFEFASIGALRERFVGIIEEHLAKGPDSREAMTGREFYFMKSVSIILPSPYVVNDLREFVETLRKISVSSLYFHMFESRLRLGKGLNDFSIWLKDSLDEGNLSEEIARLDPYTYTLEGLRLTLIQMIEKRIK